MKKYFPGTNVPPQEAIKMTDTETIYKPPFSRVALKRDFRNSLSVEELEALKIVIKAKSRFYNSIYREMVEKINLHREDTDLRGDLSEKQLYAEDKYIHCAEEIEEIDRIIQHKTNSTN